MEQLKRNKWINAGYNANLNDAGAQILANITQDELKAKGISVHNVLMAQKIAKRMAENTNKRSPQKITRKRTSVLYPDLVVSGKEQKVGGMMGNSLFMSQQSPSIPNLEPARLAPKQSAPRMLAPLAEKGESAEEDPSSLARSID